MNGELRGRLDLKITPEREQWLREKANDKKVRLSDILWSLLDEARVGEVK